LQEEARRFVADVGVATALAPLGRVIPLGSAVTGLMVWRDLDYGVDAGGRAPAEVWAAMLPLLARCDALKYENETGDRVGETAPHERHYFVLRLGGWKLDVSVWTTGAPVSVEELQRRLQERLDDELRLAILRLKDVWHADPRYPDHVSAWEIYDAVLDHGVRTLGELDAYLAERGLPTRGGA
jgi:hypothetical protein